MAINLIYELTPVYPEYVRFSREKRIINARMAVHSGIESASSSLMM